MRPQHMHMARIHVHVHAHVYVSWSDGQSCANRVAGTHRVRRAARSSGSCRARSRGARCECRAACSSSASLPARALTPPGCSRRCASPTAASALGDIIVQLDGTPITKEEDLLRALDNRKPGETVKLGLARLGERPEDGARVFRAVEVSIRLQAAEVPQRVVAG